MEKETPNEISGSDADIESTERTASSVRLIYHYTKGKWKFKHYGCPTCASSFKKKTIADIHIEKCRINTIKQQENLENKFMPIQAVMKDGKRYFRWGDSGKLYENRMDAEKQARAAYASGYREKKKDNK